MAGQVLAGALVGCVASAALLGSGRTGREIDAPSPQLVGSSEHGLGAWPADPAGAQPSQPAFQSARVAEGGPVLEAGLSALASSVQAGAGGRVR
jgi:hypothetical protein